MQNRVILVNFWTFNKSRQFQVHWPPKNIFFGQFLTSFCMSLIKKGAVHSHRMGFCSHVFLWAVKNPGIGNRLWSGVLGGSDTSVQSSVTTARLFRWSRIFEITPRHFPKSQNFASCSFRETWLNTWKICTKNDHRRLFPPTSRDGKRRPATNRVAQRLVVSLPCLTTFSGPPLGVTRHKAGVARHDRGGGSLDIPWGGNFGVTIGGGVTTAQAEVTSPNL